MKIQEEIVKIQNKGLITIPKKYRDDLGLKKNSFARLRKIKGRIILEPVRTLPYPVRSYKNSEIQEFLELDKKESKDLKRKKLI